MCLDKNFFHYSGGLLDIMHILDTSNVESQHLMGLDRSQNSRLRYMYVMTHGTVGHKSRSMQMENIPKVNGRFLPIFGGKSLCVSLTNNRDLLWSYHLRGSFPARLLSQGRFVLFQLGLFCDMRLLYPEATPVDIHSNN